MLETLLLYIFVGWFIKLDKKTHLIIRSSLAAVFGVLCLVGAIVLFTSDDVINSWSGIIPLVISLLFILRIIFDVRKIMQLSKTENKNSTKT